MRKNNQSTLLRKIAGTICMLALFSCFIGMRTFAAGNGTDMSQTAVVVSSRTTDESVYIYIKGAGDIIDGTTVQVGNKLCENVQVADMSSVGMPIRTTILFDNSLSISKRWGNQAREFVTALIEQHEEGEEFRIATFADGLNVVADFSTEYESLKAATEGIEFLNQDSYLTDTLYDLLKQSNDNHEANYTRFIIITDGADDNDIKYTQAELSELMKNSGVVIHTVGVKTSNNNSLLETLFSYARLTGGTYKVVESDTDVGSIRDMIDEDYSVLCLRLIPEADIMDGGRKEAKLSLNTSNGEVVLTASLQMPFADLSSVPQESAESTEAPAPSSAPTTEKPSLPSITVASQPEETSSKAGNNIVISIVIGAIVLAIIITLLLFVLKRKKKKQVNVVIANDKKLEDRPQNGEAQGTPAQPEDLVQMKRDTVKLGGQMNQGTERNTMRLKGRAGQNVVRQSYITLTDINNSQRSYRVAIDTKIVIGRETGDIILGHDAAVSYTHCEIIKKGNLFYINDLKSSNGTFYGSIRVYGETPIMNGGILEVGSCKYKITIET